MDIPVPRQNSPIIIETYTPPAQIEEQPAMKVDENEWAMDQASQQVNYIANDVEEILEDMITENVVTVYRNRLKLELEINNKVLFTSASALPSPEAETILMTIAQLLKDYPNQIHVEGFADNRPINSPIYPSNWELSSSRAAAVVRLFADYGINPERMASVGYGEFKPVASNDTEEGRAKNRRVVIVVLANISNTEDESDYSDLSLLNQRFSTNENTFME